MEERLLEEAFKEMMVASHGPDYQTKLPPAQVFEKWTAFMGGARSYQTVLIDGADRSSNEPTEADLQLMERVNNELEEFGRTYMQQWEQVYGRR